MPRSCYWQMGESDGWLLGSLCSFSLFPCRPVSLDLFLSSSTRICKSLCALCGLVWFGSVWGVVLGGIARVGFSHRESASPYTPDPLLILVLVSRAELEKEKNNDKKTNCPFCLFVLVSPNIPRSLSLSLSLSRGKCLGRRHGRRVWGRE